MSSINCCQYILNFQTNPYDAAQSPGHRVWRLPSESLMITAKAKKSGMHQVRYLVGIAYDRGVVVCHKIEKKGKLTGTDFAEIIESGVFRDNIPLTKQSSTINIIQDNCPVQNSSAALKAFDKQDISLVKIPARSPDINCIENFFAHLKRRLRTQAIEGNIVKESKKQFCQRIEQTLENWEIPKVNTLINSLPRRVKLLVENHGDHIPY